MKGCGMAFENGLAHRCLKLEGLLKIALPELLQVAPVLRVERQIQTKGVA
jgi:hypothetical protein